MQLFFWLTQKKNDPPAVKPSSIPSGRSVAPRTSLPPVAWWAGWVSQILRCLDRGQPTGLLSGQAAGRCLQTAPLGGEWCLLSALGCS